MTITTHSPFDKYLVLQFNSGLRERYRELQRSSRKGRRKYAHSPIQTYSMLQMPRVATPGRNPCLPTVARTDVSEYEEFSTTQYDL